MIKNQGREEVNRIYSGIRARDSALFTMLRPRWKIESVAYIRMTRPRAMAMP